MSSKARLAADLVFLEGSGKLRAKPKPRTAAKGTAKAAAKGRSSEKSAAAGTAPAETAQTTDQSTAGADKKTTKKRGTSK